MTKRLHAFGIEIDAIDRTDAVAEVLKKLESDKRTCEYVVTPNVDHIVKLGQSEDFLRAYRSASLILADGWPLVAVSKLLGTPLPERVTGSDLVPNIFAHASSTWHRDLTVYLLGSAPGVAELAARNIEEMWRNIRVVGTYSPPFGFENDSGECASICAKIAQSGAELLVLGVGAPKQELWVEKYAPQLPVKVALCVGATIDFLAGVKRRSPKWMQRAGLEWLHRMGSEPRRLAKRYAYGAVTFPFLVIKELIVGRWRSA
ncbi:WecB/TagA/CpsF family glycosyltransferase [Cupriavidus sp. L7L]|uniref:WecB/TagA/CpsF family glycosyltransferase n=1 Tax=Cupriavidus sp. L7L TaxID=2546443 RepID=UPI00105527B0|nr:WecB/TagA/CpsF family glycosyltransferase [Cupriavidus sp. L7L]TDF66165.1 glycosyltransferase [Cupriavidus sp. L7L]